MLVPGSPDPGVLLKSAKLLLLGFVQVSRGLIISVLGCDRVGNTRSITYRSPSLTRASSTRALMFQQTLKEASQFMHTTRHQSSPSPVTSFSLQ